MWPAANILNWLRVSPNESFFRFATQLLRSKLVKETIIGKNCIETASQPITTSNAIQYLSRKMSEASNWAKSLEPIIREVLTPTGF